MVGYVHRSTKNYAEMGSLAQLLKNNVDCSWSDEAKAAFNKSRAAFLKRQCWPCRMTPSHKASSATCPTLLSAVHCCNKMMQVMNEWSRTNLASSRLRRITRSWQGVVGNEVRPGKFRVHLLGSLPFVVYTTTRPSGQRRSLPTWLACCHSFRLQLYRGV
jgi:hypothetical protein